MKIIVCGDREWKDEEYLRDILDRLNRLVTYDMIIEGGARGADSMAGRWAADRGIPYRVFPADWQGLGKAAGPIRNQQMLDELDPVRDAVVAFHNNLNNSKGTKDMVVRARKKGVEVVVFPGEGDRRLDALESGAYV